MGQAYSGTSSIKTDADLDHAINEFTIKLLQEATKTEQTAFLSPFSVMAALGMAASGSTVDSDCQKELEQALGIPFSHPDAANLFSKARDTLEHSDDSVRLLLANGLFTTKAIKQKFVQNAQKLFHATAAPLKDEAAINAWVAKATDNHIKKIIDKLPDMCVAVLVNAIFFKADWTNKFDEGKTHSGKFTAPGGEQVDCKYMCSIGQRSYSTDAASYEMISIPYGKAQQFSAKIVLPTSTDENALDQLIEGLDRTMWDAWVAGLAPSAIDLQLPRFKVEYGPKDLKETLQAMGVQTAFDETITEKFLEMSDDPLVLIEQVLHKTVVEVNEQGTVAAAAGAAVMASRELILGAKDVHFNRPFLFTIVNNSTGVIVFAGKIAKPTFI